MRKTVTIIIIICVFLLLSVFGIVFTGCKGKIKLLELADTVIWGKYNFRKTMWGMSKKQVKRIEDSKIIDETNENLFYSDYEFGSPVFISYRFINDRLIQGLYSFNSMVSWHGTPRTKIDYISLFEELKQELIKKYGIPTVDTKKWENPLYIDNPEKWEFAVSIGHLTYLAKWESERSFAVLFLEGQSRAIILNLSVVEKKEHIAPAETVEGREKKQRLYCKNLEHFFAKAEKTALNKEIVRFHRGRKLFTWHRR